MPNFALCLFVKCAAAAVQAIGCWKNVKHLINFPAPPFTRDHPFFNWNFWKILIWREWYVQRGWPCTGLGRGRPRSARMNSGRLLRFNRKYRIMNAGHICWSILGTRPSFFLPTNKNQMNNSILSFLKKCLIKSLVNAFLEYFHFEQMIYVIYLWNE